MNLNSKPSLGQYPSKSDFAENTIKPAFNELQSVMESLEEVRPDTGENVKHLSGMNSRALIRQSEH